MVLQNGVYSTNNAKPQVYLPQSQKDFLERHYVKRREDERRKQDFWSSTATYYNRVERQAEKFTDLTSDDTKRASFEAANKESESERKERLLAARRSRLKSMLEDEDARLQAEMKRLPEQEKRSLVELRQIRDEWRKKKEEEQQKEVELKMLQHWKINNPKVREVESQKNEALVRKYWETQILERRREEEARRAEAEREADRRRQQESEWRDQLNREQEDRRRQVDAWKRHLESQLEQLRTKRREEEELRRLRHEQEEIQRRADKLEEAKRKGERQQAAQTLQTYQKKQHKLLLRRRAKEKEAEIEADRLRLEEMEKLLAAQDGVEKERKERAADELQWLRNVMLQQAEEERRRATEADRLFDEEAEAVWRKREDVWEREAKARQQLMDEVMTSWRQQMDERLSVARQRQEEATAERLQLEKDTEQLNMQIHAEERRAAERREQLRAGLAVGQAEKECRNREERVREEEAAVARRRQEIREENKLARELATVRLETIQANSKQQDFRRKKVRWYY